MDLTGVIPMVVLLVELERAGAGSVTSARSRLVGAASWLGITFGHPIQTGSIPMKVGAVRVGSSGTKLAGAMFVSMVPTRFGVM